MLHDEPPFVSELYSAYAAGRLSPAYALLVQTQAAMREDIALDLALSESVAGHFLEHERRELMSPNAFETALKAIDAITETEADAADAARAAGDSLQELLKLPEPLREKALEACIRKGWRRLTGGVSRLDLGNNVAVRAHLYRISPGASVPRHSHYGEELTLVIQGGFSDAGGQYGPGDISRQTPKDTHKPVADDDEVCFALAVSEGGMKFSGILGLIQKIAR